MDGHYEYMLELSKNVAVVDVLTDELSIYKMGGGLFSLIAVVSLFVNNLIT